MAICIFEILEIAELGIWPMGVASVNPLLSPPPPSEERIQDAGPVSSPTGVRVGALQGADVPGQLPQRAHCTADELPPKSAVGPFFASLCVTRRTL